MPVDEMELGQRLGMLAAQNAAIITRLEHLEKDMASLREDAARGKGAIAVLIGLGAAVGAIGTAIFGQFIPKILH